MQGGCAITGGATHTLLLCGMLLTLAANASSEPKTSAGASSKYIVIDAGSSGCRVHVYTISQQPGQQLPAVELPDKKLKKSPGLSSFAKNPTDAGASLAGLLVFAKQHVPADEHQATPIRLAATAGLRLLPKETSDAILDSCYTYLKENSKFLVTRDKISVITGRDEGAYGWLSINFLMNRLNGMSDAREGTTGSIEMGGASSQVTVQLKGEVIPRFSYALHFPLQQAAFFRNGHGSHCCLCDSKSSIIFGKHVRWLVH